MTAAELVGIAHAVHVRFRFRREVAEEYRVSIGLVSRVASKCKSGIGWLEERQAKEAKQNFWVGTVR